jgi:hypothetical protein
MGPPFEVGSRDAMVTSTAERIPAGPEPADSPDDAAQT